MSAVPVRSAAAAALVLVAGLAVSACNEDEPDPDTESRELVLSFDDGVQSAGAVALEVTTVTANGGEVTEEPRDDGTALRFPEFATTGAGLATVAVVDRDGEDDLAPGTRTFRFGAEFAVDEKSSGSPVDNGDNLVQRGLYDAVGQYKLQLDGDVTSCRVKGAEGEVEVAIDQDVTPGEWYRATCTRYDSRVELELVRLSDGESWTESVNGKTGDVAAESRDVPFSVGGKLDWRGELMAKDSDQFNGLIDEVFLDIVE